MKQKVVVIGHGYTSRLGVIRALGRAGYDVTVIVMTFLNKNGKAVCEKPIDIYSKYVHRVYYCVTDGDRLIDMLLDKCVDVNQRVVIIPDSDFSAATIDKNQDRLKEYFLFPNINHESSAIVRWMDKMRQKTVAADVGLNVAKGWCIEINNGEYTIPKELHYPCFPKPLATLVGAKTGLGRCNSEVDLRKSLALLIKRNPTISVLVEEYKKIETEYALLGVTDGKNVFIPGIIQQISLANGGHFGVSKQGMIKSVKGFENVIEQFKAFVLQTGFRGIFDIDFYKSDDKIYFCEMNFRYGGSGYAYTKMGVNLPATYVGIETGRTLEGQKTVITEDLVFLNERMCLDDWYNGFITTKQFKTIARTSDISFVFDKEDRMPGMMFKKQVCITALKRLVKRYMRQ